MDGRMDKCGCVERRRKRKERNFLLGSEADGKHGAEGWDRV